MKKIICSALIISVFVCSVLGCSNYRARRLGGHSKIVLDKGKQLKTAAFDRGSNVWVLVQNRPEGVAPQCYDFKEYSDLGILNGTIEICEE